MKNRFILLAFLCFQCLKVFSQTPPSDTYLKSMNSFLPGSPEAAQIMKYQDYPVNLFTGVPEISIPIFTVSGKGISVPISLSYHGGGGIKVDEQATNIGLNWALEAGGEITRDMRGGPDEGGSGTSGFINKPYTIANYVDDFNCCSGTYINQQLWVDAMNGHTDLEPDIFYFSFGGHSGKFIFDDSLRQFVCLTDNSHLNIALDDSADPNSFFTITTDEGNKYIFANRETSYSIITNVGGSASTASASPSQTTSWKLSKIINADATDSIVLTYTAENYSYYSEGSNIIYQALQGAARNPVLSYSLNTIQGNAKLANISGNSFSVDFTDDGVDRQDLFTGGNYALGKITVKNSSNQVQDIFVLHHGYYQRDYVIGATPVSSPSILLLRRSLRLDSISEYGNSQTNPSPLRHAFTYDATQLPGRLSFQKDWWGYPNNNTYTPSLVPPPFLNDGLSHPGADRTPYASKTGAGILTAVRLPTGGTVSYAYEPNTTGYAVWQAVAQDTRVLSIGQEIFEGPDADLSQVFFDSTLDFTINEAPNAVTNGYLGGVTANINIMPIAPPPPIGGSQGFSDAYPIYYIDKLSEADGSQTTGPLEDFHRQLQSQGLYQVHMPNGRYRMHFYPFNYNQHLPPIYPLNENGVPYDDGRPHTRIAQFTVDYHILDTSGAPINYNLAGVRVKTITTTDQYSNVTNTRNFHYHDPVTDSSYGQFIGSSRGDFVESSQFGQWTVRMGSYNMPGAGGNASNVVYPIVYEDVTQNGITYRTEHYYSRGYGLFPTYGNIFPFIPSNDIECSRGNEYKTIWDKNNYTDFTPAKIRQQVFNFNPHAFAAPNSLFSRQLFGIKCTASSFDANIVVAGGYAPPFVLPYPINIGNRLYLTSDTTTTYDLNNQYNGFTQWHDYTYGDYNHQPIITRTGNSDGSVYTQKDYYPTDKPDANSELSTSNFTAVSSLLKAANRITEPLGTKQFKDGELVSQQYFYSHFNGNQFVKDSVRQALFSNPLDVELKVLSYDVFANPLTIGLRGDKYRKYVWNKDRGLPLATCVASQNDLFYFNSFEYPADGGISGSSFSGSRAFQLSSTNYLNILSDTPFGNEDVYVWATNGVPKVNNIIMGSTGKTKGSWTLYTSHVNGGSNVTITGSALIDQAIVIPSGSDFQGNVYDASNRVIARVNNQIETNFYEYDPFGRLTIMRDEQGNILKSSTYQYQTAQ